ncbi:MAG TPA: PQQ-binding-like beta-propeller repeat protein [Anaerolineales bacterium]|nr:PQQ-binding-like beta-propeller repeat protein [Anaerolineales bacterium]
MKAHWVYETAGAIWGSPALDAGTVYTGSDDGNLYALDARTGKFKWKFASKGIVRSQPAVAGGLVYFSSDDGFLYAVNAKDGKPAWSFDIGNYLDRAARENLGNSPSPTGYDYVQSSPVVAEGTVFVGSLNGNLYALAADTGKLEWTFATANKIRATPAVDRGTVYVGSWDKLLYAVDASTGKVRWASPVGGEVQSTALVANGLVYCASRKASVVALDAATGELKWEHSYGNNMWVESSPRLVDGVIYIGSSGSKFVLGLDALTGKPTAIFMSPDFHWSTPLVVLDTLYIGGTSYKPDQTGGIYALKIVDGKFSTLDQDRQVFPVVDTLEASGNWNGVASSPVLGDGLFYFGGLDGKLYAVNTLP